jgi:hypothetical protein
MSDALRFEMRPDTECQLACDLEPNCNNTGRVPCPTCHPLRGVG